MRALLTQGAQCERGKPEAWDGRDKRGHDEYSSTQHHDCGGAAVSQA